MDPSKSDELKKLIKDFLPYAQKRMGFTKKPRILFRRDKQNAQNILGKTAHYNPESLTVVLYIHNRHPKDIMRSLSHELVHHAQNLRGDLSPEKCGQMTDKYAQENPHMRKMEEEAYLIGNMCFRDWEDSEKFTMKESKMLKENKKMTTKITKGSLKNMIRTILKDGNRK